MYTVIEIDMRCVHFLRYASDCNNRLFNATTTLPLTRSDVRRRLVHRRWCTDAPLRWYASRSDVRSVGDYDQRRRRADRTHAHRSASPARGFERASRPRPSHATSCAFSRRAPAESLVWLGWSQSVFKIYFVAILLLTLKDVEFASNNEKSTNFLWLDNMQTKKKNLENKKRHFKIPIIKKIILFFRFWARFFNDSLRPSVRDYAHSSTARIILEFCRLMLKCYVKT